MSRKYLLWPFALCVLPVFPASANGDPAWDRLTREVAARRVELTAQIREAQQQGLATDYALVSEQVLAAFQAEHAQVMRRCEMRRLVVNQSAINGRCSR